MDISHINQEQEHDNAEWQTIEEYEMNNEDALEKVKNEIDRIKILDRNCSLTFLVWLMPCELGKIN